MSADDPSRPPPLLRVEGLALAFGGVRALSDVDLAVSEGAICGLVGPNGAGKTSLFNCICGYYTPTSGRILLRGDDISRFRPSRRVVQGVARTFQHPVLQRDRSVLENVVAGGHSTQPGGPVRHALRIGVRAGERQVTTLAAELLDYLGIAHLARVNAGQLSYGGQKRVELARALMSRPSLLLLDELASGLTHEEVLAMGEQIRAVRTDLDVGIVLVEHHMGMIAAVTDHVVVLVQGRTVAAGTAAEVQRQPVVIEAYLGAAA